MVELRSIIEGNESRKNTAENRNSKNEDELKKPKKEVREPKKKLWDTESSSRVIRDDRKRSNMHKYWLTRQ